jgi:hypothetical protein
MKKFGAFITKLYSTDRVSFFPIYILVVKESGKVSFYNTPEIAFGVIEGPTVFYPIEE